MLIPFSKRTGEVIPDFQAKATADALVANAVKAGHQAEDVEVRDLPAEEAKALEDAYFHDAREQLKAEESARAAAADALKKRLGLSDPDVQALRDLLAG